MRKIFPGKRALLALIFSHNKVFQVKSGFILCAQNRREIFFLKRAETDAFSFFKDAALAVENKKTRCFHRNLVSVLHPFFLFFVAAVFDWAVVI